MSKIIKNQTTTPQLIANNMSGCFFLKHGVCVFYCRYCVSLSYYVFVLHFVQFLTTCFWRNVDVISLPEIYRPTVNC